MSRLRAGLRRGGRRDLESLVVFVPALVLDVGPCRFFVHRAHRRAKIPASPQALPPVAGLNRAMEAKFQEPAILCPHCNCVLSEKEIWNMLGQFARSKRLSYLGATRFAKLTPEERSAESIP